MRLENPNFVTRKGKFDAAHRVLHERFKCFNLHGHEYHYELTFSWSQDIGLGYGIDFKEIKRVVGKWIDSRLDHGFIANPKDLDFIEICRKNRLKVYEMNGVDTNGFCNPSAENIAKELFFASMILLQSSGLRIHSVRLFETINCFVECPALDATEIKLLTESPLFEDLVNWKKACGVIEYDERLVNNGKFWAANEDQ